MIQLLIVLSVMRLDPFSWMRLVCSLDAPVINLKCSQFSTPIGRDLAGWGCRWIAEHMLGRNMSGLWAESGVPSQLPGSLERFYSYNAIGWRESRRRWSIFLLPRTGCWLEILKFFLTLHPVVFFSFLASFQFVIDVQNQSRRICQFWELAWTWAN